MGTVNFQRSPLKQTVLSSQKQKAFQEHMRVRHVARNVRKYGTHQSML
jgi:hypothetical protein